ncbi:MAG TPA: DegT/DnrJ/EryC1/StrS family aminotransferase [Cyclobacteriaceae bacterium]|nr:DegT/DnrJ/EryC1/StrS family aminotransferase [Cyclobacteriaceae bacterium]
MRVPFIDLEAQYQSLKDELDQAINDAVKGFNFIRGKEVAQFEEAFGRTIGLPHVVATGNGTDALLIALKVLGIGPGDEVITPAFSCVPSAEVITLCQARPVFADVHPETYTLDPDRLAERITPQTKAVIVVHLFGQAAHIEEIRAVCDRHNLLLIEDCAQAHGTEINAHFAGSFGHAAAFSFYPTKNLGAYGDAGCFATYSPQLAEKARRFANHGALEKDDHLIEGFNSRMDTLQGAVLLTKLPHLPAWNDKRRGHAGRYQALLDGIGGIATPSTRSASTHTFHIYAIRAQKRDALKTFLRDRGIQTMVHYPYAIHNLPAYRHLGYHPDDFPVANRLPHELLSLPIYPEITDEQVRYVSATIRDFYETPQQKNQ